MKLFVFHFDFYNLKILDTLVDVRLLCFNSLLGCRDKPKQRNCN